MPYDNYSRCKAEFNCPDNKVIGYLIERFDIEEHATCDDDSQGMYNLYIKN